MTKNSKRHARRHTQAVQANLTVKSSWPDMVTDKKMLNWSRMHRTTKARLGVAAR